MKNYLLFAFDQYYPKGGLNDIKHTFNNIEELEEQSLQLDYEQYQLLNTDTRQQTSFYLDKALEKHIEEDTYLSGEQEKEEKKRVLLQWIEEFIN